MCLHSAEVGVYMDLLVVAAQYNLNLHGLEEYIRAFQGACRVLQSIAKYCSVST